MLPIGRLFFPACVALLALTLPGLASTPLEIADGENANGWLIVAQETAKEKLEKTAPASARREKGRAAANDDDDNEDYGDDEDRSRRRVCPPGQRPTPHRGRGGDRGGCI
jgi:hypothetical protein